MRSAGCWGSKAASGRRIGLAPDFIKTVVTAVGNYGEIFDCNFWPQLPAPRVARGQNALWSNGGLIYAPSVEEDGDPAGD